MQNLISMTLSPSDLQEVDAALETLRRVFAPMISLEAQQRRELTKMGAKSEAFCRQTLTVLAANPQIVPPNLGLAEAQADLAALNALRPRLLLLQQLTERAEDSVLALGSDLMQVALEGSDRKCNMKEWLSSKRDLDGDAPTTWLSNRFCAHHDPKNPRSEYRRDVRYRSALESALHALRQAFNTDPSFRLAIAGGTPRCKWPPDIHVSRFSAKVRTAFSPVAMQMRWHAYQLARHRPSHSIISAVRLASLGCSQAEVARRLGISPQAVSKALKQVRGVFDFTRPPPLVWMADPADAPNVPSYIRLE